MPTPVGDDEGTALQRSATGLSRLGQILVAAILALFVVLAVVVISSDTINSAWLALGALIGIILVIVISMVLPRRLPRP